MRTRTFVALAAFLAALTLAAGALAAVPAKIFFEDSIPSGSSSSITVTTHRSAAFKVLLRVPTAGTAKLYLLGKKAPKGGPLIETSNVKEGSSCSGAAGSFYCKASYEPLPRGTYTWRITWKSMVVQGPRMPAHVELTVTW